MTLFFVLSGFLITGVLLEEYELVGSIRLSAFYKRRVRRLLPALGASTFAVAVAATWLGDWWIKWQDIPSVLLYYGNWIQAGPGDLGALGATWSLAVEEQFYLLWPLSLLWLASRGRGVVLRVAAAGAACSLGARIVLITSGATTDRVYFGSDTVALALLAGAALVSWQGGKPPPRPRPLIATAAAAAIVAVSTWTAVTAAYLSLPVASLASVLLIREVTGPVGGSLLESRAVVWLGQRSYGLYLWHAPLTWALRVGAGWKWPALVAVVVPASLMLAEISYRWVEGPWRVARDPEGKGRRTSTSLSDPLRPLMGAND